MTGSLFLFLVFSCFCAGKPVNKDDSWEFLHLAQFWPATSCYVYFGKQDCSGIPQSVTSWTIHGLWPSRRNNDDPQYCNSSLKFDYNEIKGLSSTLEKRWPSYNTSADPTSLWKHEWEKHGTCAMSLPALRGEPSYFSLTLVLQQPLDIYGNLKRHKILPSSTVLYQPADIYWAMRDGLGVDPNIICMYDKQTQRHYIEQVWICYTKEFLLQDCPYMNQTTNGTKEPSRFSNCPDIGTPSVYYLPLTPPSLEHREKISSEHKMDEAKKQHSVQEGNKLHKQPHKNKYNKSWKQTKASLESVIYFRSEVQEILRRH